MPTASASNRAGDRAGPRATGRLGEEEEKLPVRCTGAGAETGEVAPEARTVIKFGGNVLARQVPDFQSGPATGARRPGHFPYSGLPPDEASSRAAFGVQEISKEKR